jgi:hypothetical protein
VLCLHFERESESGANAKVIDMRRIDAGFAAELSHRQTLKLTISHLSLH